MSFNEAYFLLSAQTALLGHVVPSLRAVTIDFDERKKMLKLHFFYDAEITEHLFDLASVTSAEIELDPTSGHRFELMNEDIAISLPYPKPIPIEGKLIYLRKEDIQTDHIRIIHQHHLWPINVFRLAMQEALLGKVTPALRKAIIDINEEQKRLLFHFFYHGGFSQQELDLADSIVEDVHRAFSDFKIEKNIIRNDYPEPILAKGSVVYSRAFP